MKGRGLMSTNVMEQVVLTTQNWNGNSSCDILQANSRQEAIEKAVAESTDQKYTYLGTKVEFDDGNRILIHVEHGYEFHGWRISHQYFYFDPTASVEEDEDDLVHHLSITELV